MSYLIPEDKRQAVQIFMKECEEQISAYLNIPVRVVFTVHAGRVTEENIRQIVLDSYAVTWAQIGSKNRKAHIVLARHAYAWLCRKYTALSVREIGININRHYSSVINSSHIVDSMMFTKDEETMTKLQPIIDHLNKALSDEQI